MADCRPVAAVLAPYPSPVRREIPIGGRLSPAPTRIQLSLDRQPLFEGRQHQRPIACRQVEEDNRPGENRDEYDPRRFDRQPPRIDHPNAQIRRRTTRPTTPIRPLKPIQNASPGGSGGGSVHIHR
jgi:hypothetical protein